MANPSVGIEEILARLMKDELNEVTSMLAYSGEMSRTMIGNSSLLMLLIRCRSKIDTYVKGCGDALVEEI